ncbi:MAG: hypothetical protein JXR37_03420 [Kiritimatiellae bacterium]|nr:hypothetical protein [Kiritimatiellia bacterium]
MRKSTPLNAIAACLVVFANALAAPEADPPLPRITKLKKLYPATSLVEAGQPRAFIVMPDDPAYAAPAQRVVQLLQQKSGAALPVVKASSFISADWRIDHKAIGGRNLIALGNVNDNRLLSVLYGEQYVLADSIYPGKGGHVVRTVHDPWATGVNVLVLAGSGIEGVQKAVSVFEQKYLAGGPTVVLPEPIVDVAFEKKAYPFFPDQTKETWSKRQPQYRTLEAWLEKYPTDPARPPETEGSFMRVTGTLSSMGETYFRTGWKDLLPLMKYRVEKYRACLKNPAAYDPKSMSGRSSDHVHGWDILEELPIWTDEERLEISNALLGDAALGCEKRGFHGAVKKGYVQVLDENHGTFSAQRSFDAWHYFHKYYAIPASAYWMKCADAVFSAQASTFQILEDASGYLCYAPNSTMKYALASGDLEYFTRGVARQHAEFVALVCVNNLGLGTGFGDSPGLVQWNTWDLLARASWFYRDPYLSYVLREKLPRNSGGRVFNGGYVFDLSVAPKEPVQWTGVIRVPLFKNPLAETEHRSTEKVYAPKEEEDAALFNKVVFKENWDVDGQYLLLDGAGVSSKSDKRGPHGHAHTDVNTIINFTDEGRMWLVDHTYEERAFQEHSGAELIREGASEHPERALAKLLHCEQRPDGGITQSRVGRWQRSLFWKKGRYFLVLDELTAGRDGDYLARCRFKTLGEETLRGADLYLAQQGKFCRILSDGDADVSVEPRDFASKGDWTSPYHGYAPYPWAEPVAKFFIQDKTAALKKGDRVTFLNLLHAYADPAEEQTVRMAPVSDACALVTDNGAPAVLGTGPLPGGAGTADLFVVTPGSVWALGARQPIANEAAGRIIAAAQGLAQQRASQRAAAAAAAKPEIHNLRCKAVKLPVPVTTLLAADIDGDGRSEWIAGGGQGLAVCRDDGSAMWTYPTKQDVRALDAGDLNGDGRLEVVFGCDDEKARAMDPSGKLLWEFTCKEVPRSNHKPPAVDHVKITDLENDGEPEVVVCGNWIHALTASGAVKWERWMRNFRGRKRGDFQCGDVADIDGDGNKEVVAAYLDPYCLIQAINAKGEIVLPVGVDWDGAGHPGLSLGVPNRLITLNVFGQGTTRQIVVATKGQLSYFWHDQKLTPREERFAKGYQHGPFVNLCAFERGNGKAPVVIAGNNVYGLTGVEAYRDGNPRSIRTRKLWYKTIGEQPTALLALDLDRDKKGEVLVGTHKGNVYALDVETGATKGFAKVHGAPVTALALDAKAGSVLAGMADGTVWVIGEP